MAVPHLSTYAFYTALPPLEYMLSTGLCYLHDFRDPFGFPVTYLESLATPPSSAKIHQT